MRNLFLLSNNLLRGSSLKESRSDVKKLFILLFIVLQLISTINIYAATITTSGSGNWISTTPNAPWPGGVIPANTDDIIIGNGNTLTVNGNRTCNSISFTVPNSGTGSGTLSVNPGFLLTVLTAISCPGAGVNIKSNGTFNISGLGEIACSTLNCNNTTIPGGSNSTVITVVSTIKNLTISGNANLYSTFKASGSKANNATLNIQSGTVTVRGRVTTNNSSIVNEATIDLETSAFSPSLILEGLTPFDLDETGMNTMKLNGAGATTDFRAAAAQSIPSYTYANLSLSGAGLKTFLSTPIITGNLSLSGTASIKPTTALTIGGDVTIDADAMFTAGSFTHNVGGKWTNNGTFNAETSTVNLNGSSPQTVMGTIGSVFNNLMLGNPAGISLTAPVRITNFLSFGNVNNSVLSTGGLLTLGSVSSGSATLKDVTNGGINSGNRVNGNVTVERFIQGKRAYRFLSVPVNSTTSIKANWMENVNNTSAGTNIDPVPGYGTQITGAGGSANGFDPSGTNNPSLFTFNLATQTWTPVANTNGVFSAGTGYRIMVRGSRNVNLNDNNADPSATILRATGTLLTGTVTMSKAGSGTVGMPSLSSQNNAFSFIANPYASSVNWLSVNKTDLSTTLYVYDPTVSGSNGRGIYVAYNGGLDINNNENSLIDNHIQSGQAFYVVTKGPNPSLTFKETHKSTNFNPVFRTAAKDLPNVSIQLLLPSQPDTAAAADGAKVFFSENFSSSLGDEDSYKFSNPDENIAIIKENAALCIEGRKPVSGSDTVQLKIWQLSQSKYTLKVDFSNFPEKVQGYLEDSYSHIKLRMNANSTTLLPFGITSDAVSKAADRFKIVFETLATLPVKLTGIKGYLKNQGVQVDWRAESESNMNFYEVERSSNAWDFAPVGSVKAKNNGVTGVYNFFDINAGAGTNYYRIKSIEKSGDVKFSEVVRVQVAKEKNSISVCNNPIQSNTVKLLFDNAEAGNYRVSLINSLGAQFYNSAISYTGGTVYQQLKLNTHLPVGVYQLQVNDGIMNKSIQVVVN